jgi:DNA processing protein
MKKKKMNLNQDKRLAWLALATVPKVGPVRIRQLIRNFKTPEAILHAGRADLENLPDIGPKLASLIAREADFGKAEKQLELLEKSAYKLAVFESDEYPESLKNIYDPPPFIFYEGDVDCLKRPCLAVVGPRSASSYGRMMAEKLVRELIEAGFTIVSGFARGIDTIAHRTAVDSGGLTSAVFGCGIDTIYPPENKTLYRNLVLNGCAISEFFLKEKPEPKYFPRRNRIISGLSLGVLVVEAGEKSGALLTAQHALDQGREVFAVPGNINSRTSKGTNRIIRDGAKLVTSAEDVLEELKFLVPSSRPVDENRITPHLEGVQKKIYDILSNQPIQLDKIVKRAQMPVSSALEILLELELNGLVRQLSGKMFVKQF